MEGLKQCTLCPHNCRVNRFNGEVGRCRAGKNVKIALVSKHKFEEPCISGENGSGTIFFSNCNLNCMYCQNYEISQMGKGREITIDELAKYFFKQQEEGAHNVNLVTPTSYVYHIIEAIKIAKANGLKIPIVYNTNGYERVETLKLLEGYVDIYLPDFKYYDDEIARKYSKIDNYFEIATAAIKEMYRQVGKPILDENGIMQKGVIIRHLILPNNISNTKKILKWIKDNLDNDIFISIMAQYFPTYMAKKSEDLNRKLTYKEYEEVEDFLYNLELENGYIQELGDHEEEYVPKWEF